MTEVKIDVVIECADTETATALNLVLLPDNRFFPKDQTFESSRDGANLRFTVKSSRLRPTLTSVDSIVADAALFQKIWDETTSNTSEVGASSSL